MKQARLRLEIDVDYIVKGREELEKVAEIRYNPETKLNLCIFPIENVNRVREILAEPIKVAEEDNAIITSLADPKKEEVQIPSSYGQGYVRVEKHPTLPDIYVVTIIRNKKQVISNVPTEAVMKMWEAVQKQPLGKKVYTPTVAEKYCRLMGWKEFFNGENGRFSFKYFFGSRKYYMKFYCALKVLVAGKMVEHVCKASTSGVIRLKDKFEIQTNLRWQS